MGKTRAMGRATVRDRAVRGFTSRYERAPEAVWSAPGRANLIGEHTDYNDGFVLPFAIGERTAVAAARRRDDTIAVASTGYPAVRVRLAEIAPGTVSGWSAYPLGVAWALGQARDLNGSAGAGPAGADLFIDSDVPPGAGLSSSAALEMAVAGALAELWGLNLGTAEFARAGQRAENEVVGAPTGVMDQYASLLGRADAAVFLDCRSLVARSVPLRLTPAGMALVLTDTGERHAHATGGYAARRASCEKGAALLRVPALRDLSVADLPRAEAALDAETGRRVRHVVTENARVEATVADLAAGDLAAAGRRLTASHASMRDDYEITTPALDLAVEVALAAGALGARMTGGGFGGSAIALIEEARVADLTEAVADAFAAAGFGPPRISRVTPSAGAGTEM
ncbi:galactokinase [Trebonia kvetii]|nr:galactokinase [Trebonia kvetii]